ncbi:hypothetical protein JRO89_XS12G0070900 [Xanthoceras sorbifolium]|uniref:BHLH domain-containing protein n=1 Tax=Xanthoceras sorbifolium TaxID=99658 RepID=A0ABQ8HBK3_9ROSI|nr:hypothetical protein JRO89_XS12G0070900 [Xanthoceras sorbifolium]
MDYCFSTDSQNSTGTSSSSVVPNSTSKGKKKKKSGSNRRVKLSTDPQSVAARERRHRISDRFKILQSLVPGGSKMDTVSMLEEAIHYVKYSTCSFSSGGFLLIKLYKLNNDDSSSAAATLCGASTAATVSTTTTTTTSFSGF